LAALHDLGVSEAAAAIRTGRTSAEQLAEALLTRAAAHAHLNAFITIEPEHVREAARAADLRRAAGDALGPLHGVPLAIKDNIDTAGTLTTGGTPGLRSNRPKRDAAVLQKLRGAGAIVLAKCNMHELAFGITSNNAAFGAVRNPYAPDRIPGGSSGGTGAAVAARLAPGGLGTDTGGSVRIPAALCGIVGFRPSLGRWPQGGIVPISHTRDTPGPMARSVADCALLDDVVAGGGEALVPARLEGLRLGLPRGHFWEKLDAELGNLCEAALGRLRAAGVTLVEADIPEAAPLDAAAGFTIALYEVVVDLGRYLADHEGAPDFRAIAAQAASPDVKGVLDAVAGAGAVPEAAYREAIDKQRPALQAAYRRHFSEQNVAAIIFPTTPAPAAAIGEDETVSINGEALPTFLTFIRNTGPGSVAGVPGLSLPAGTTKAGLPVGLEICGPEGSDRALLAIGAAIEALLPSMPAPPMRS
jgi:mandelamide amidase